MLRQFVSCPCCGQSAKLAALNFTEDGARVPDPVQYGAFLKTQHVGGRAGIRWASQPMPRHMLQGLLVQLEQATSYVRSQLASL